MMHALKPALAIFLVACCISLRAQPAADTASIAWRPGYLDIHHILTGSGDCSFTVMPDGTTLLVDAGDIGDRAYKRSGFPLTSTPPYPDNSKSAGQWIAAYIQQVLPAAPAPVIDYALITHYHDDHMGGLTPATPTARNGQYKLSGITDVGDALRIRKVIDRGYSFPVDLKAAYAREPSAFLNLQRFIAFQQKQNGLVAEPLRAGSVSQIVMKHARQKYPSFMVRGVKINGTIWTGTGTETVEHFTADSVVDAAGRFQENPLCLAIKISYGRFDYFTGGDNTGLRGFGMPAWFDVETPMARAVGKVEASTLCHHGCRDAVNENFLRYLQPQTLVHQTWSSNHPGEEVLHRIIYQGVKHVFATNIQEATRATLGFWLTDTYASTFGHIILRVLPGGDRYYVLIAETVNEKIVIKKVFGPYAAED